MRKMQKNQRDYPENQVKQEEKMNILNCQEEFARECKTGFLGQALMDALSLE